MFNAGSSRILSFAFSTSTPCSMHSAMTSFTGRFVLTPSIRPSPVTSSTPGAPVSAVRIMFDFACTRLSSASSMRSRMLTPPAQLIGFPPNVEP